LLILLKNLYSKKSNAFAQLDVHHAQHLRGESQDYCGRDKVRTSSKSIDGIGISQYLFLVFILAQTYIGTKEQEAVPKDGIPSIR
jgi:hypothetical protein